MRREVRQTAMFYFQTLDAQRWRDENISAEGQRKSKQKNKGALIELACKDR